MKFQLMASTRILLLLIFCTSCGKRTGSGKAHLQSDKSYVMVFAAASLTDVVMELADSFEMKYGVEIKLNIASSGTLARQIEQGAPSDVFISANEEWFNYTDSLGYIQNHSNTIVAKNRLALIAPASSRLKNVIIDSTLNLTDLLSGERLSMGDPNHVPAGKYARQSLSYFGWFERVKVSLLLAKDVRSALMIVELEETPIGIVYYTDALKSTKVKVLSLFPETTHEPITYMAGVCNNKGIANDFFGFINTDEAKDIWLKYGFIK